MKELILYSIYKSISFGLESLCSRGTSYGNTRGYGFMRSVGIRCGCSHKTFLGNEN